MVITVEDMALSDMMLKEAEKHMHRVFSAIGQSPEAQQADRLLRFIRYYGKVPYAQALMHVRNSFPDARDFEGVLKGLIDSQQVRLVFEGLPRMEGGKMVQDTFLQYTGG
jgi:hypothetical protein